MAAEVIPNKLVPFRWLSGWADQKLVDLFQGGPIQLHVLLAGLNTVCVDAVGVAVMGFDPMADRGTAPFETCDSTLRLAEELGVGTRDLKRIEVIGEKISGVVLGARPDARGEQHTIRCDQ
jgi:hypothetical protein